MTTKINITERLLIIVSVFFLIVSILQCGNDAMPSHPGRYEPIHEVR